MRISKALRSKLCAQRAICNARLLVIETMFEIKTDVHVAMAGGASVLVKQAF